jgi:hypothetical protein
MTAVVRTVRRLVGDLRYGLVLSCIGAVGITLCGPFSWGGVLWLTGFLWQIALIIYLTVANIHVHPINDKPNKGGSHDR